MSLDRPAVWSAAIPLPDAALDGFAWDDSDLVIGAAGLAARGGRLPPVGADGCHLTCRAVAGGHLVSADARGFARLYLYRAGRRWAVSRSFARLVDHVAGQGWPVTPRPWALSLWQVPGTMFDQSIIAATVVAEITALPSWRAVMIAGGAASPVPVQVPVPVPAPAPQVGPVLYRAIAVWLGRLRTVLDDPRMVFTADLTGGLDTRICLSMLLHLRATGQVADSALRFTSALRQGDDLRIARQLAAQYGLTLNTPVPAGVTAGAEARFATWRDSALGMFAPFYPPPAQVVPGRITLGGHGGEYLRLMTWAQPRRRIAAEAAPRLAPAARLHFNLALWRAWHDAQGRLCRNVTPACQFRWTARLRQLAGHHAQSALRVSPLAGAAFAPLVAQASTEDMRTARLGFAIIARLAPGLEDQPFADAATMPPPGLSRGGAAIIGVPGRIWGDPQAMSAPADGGPGSLRDRFRHAVAAADEAGAARLVGSATVAAAGAALTGAGQGPEDMPDRTGFRPVHATLLAGLVTAARRQG